MSKPKVAPVAPRRCQRCRAELPLDAFSVNRGTHGRPSRAEPDHVVAAVVALVDAIVTSPEYADQRKYAAGSVEARCGATATRKAGADMVLTSTARPAFP